VQRIEESERLLRVSRAIYDVTIHPVAYRDGVVDIEVRTRDTWSLEPGLSVSREGGKNAGRVSIEEENLLGTGIAVGVAYKHDVDRSGTQFHIADSNIRGSRTGVSYAYTKQDDGSAQSFSLAQPFYALDTRRATGFSASRSDTIDALYNSGNNVAEYSHQHRSGEAYTGWSPGLVRGWTRRYSIGFQYQDDDYEPRPDRPALVRVPSDLTIAAPFLRFELIEDAFRKDTNLTQIGRVEDVRMGLQSTAQLGRALTALGATRDMWVYSTSVSNGFDVTKDSILLTAASFAGRYAGGGSENQSLGASARYFHRQGRHVVHYVSVSGDLARDPDIPGPLQLGGDNGLRGYPLRYQAGERRALLTLETRAYSDWYPFRLIRVGGAVFYDVGRAWRGENQNPTNPGWLSDVGFGLRFLNARTAFGNVLHADIAFPLNREGDIKSVQFVLRTKVAL
jgi:outer membrane protein assembly factor BamA